MPRQSNLIPYMNEIVTLRRRRPPMPFSKIADLLREKYQISIRKESVYKFIKNRSKGYKPCKYAWNVEFNNADNKPTTEAPSAQKQTVTDMPKTSDNSDYEPFEYTYSPEYNLTRLPPEEAAARLKKLEERKLEEERNRNQ